MTDAANTRFTTDELLPYAQGNATAFVLSTIAHLKRQGLAVDDYVRFFGSRFAPVAEARTSDADGGGPTTT